MMDYHNKEKSVIKRIDILSKQNEKTTHQLENERLKLKALQMQKDIEFGIHHLFSDGSGNYETVCGYKLILQKSKNPPFHFDSFKNATIYFDFIENKCPICELNDRVCGDNCPTCGVFRDTPKDIYCGNCGKVTGKRRKLKGVPDDKEIKELLGLE